jgi:hypothetical protein
MLEKHIKLGHVTNKIYNFDIVKEWIRTFVCKNQHILLQI